MSVLVVGATGGTGRCVVNAAVAANHRVIAAARNPATVGDSVVPLTIDFTEAAAFAVLAEALGSSDTVISTLGPRRKSEAGIVTQGTRIIVDAMKEAGARRLITISAAPVRDTALSSRSGSPVRDPGDDWVTAKVMMPIVRKVFGYVYDDLAHMEDLIVGSGLDWTIVRPPRLTNHRDSRKIRSNSRHNIAHGRSLSRRDLAQYMVDIIPQVATFESIIRLAY